MAALRALCDAVIFTGEAFVEGHALLLKDGKVLDLVRKAPAEADIVSCRKQILTPGLIDIQANGGGNILFNNTPTEDACLAIAKAHRRFGTARLLPTLITDRPDVTPKAIAATRAARKKDASVLGIHIEGPHLETAARGVHKADFLRKLSAADKEHYRPEKGEIILLTVAPEATTPLEIKTLHAEGVIISLGHTKADGAQIQAAREAGATGFTHLFNGMNFNRGANGLSAPVKAALEDKKSWCSIIADGHHVSVEYIRNPSRCMARKFALRMDSASIPKANWRAP
jgi:N-acetylglucosamine-6-phosphate deacetylase